MINFKLHHNISWVLLTGLSDFIAKAKGIILFSPGRSAKAAKGVEMANGPGILGRQPGLSGFLTFDWMHPPKWVTETWGSKGHNFCVSMGPCPLSQPLVQQDSRCVHLACKNLSLPNSREPSVFCPIVPESGQIQGFQKEPSFDGDDGSLE